MKKKKGYNKILIFVVVLIIIIALVIGFVILNSHKKENNNNNNNNIQPAVENSASNNSTNENNNLPNENVVNNTEVPVITAGENVSFGKLLVITIRAGNPQYKANQDVKILYTIQNTGNTTLNIPQNVINRIEIKNSGGKVIDYSGTGAGIIFINDSYSILPGQKISGSFTIGASDYDFFTNGNVANGYYDSIDLYLGNTRSNIVVLRFIQK